jgi:uncharacterized protein (DUF1330 family)
MAAFLIGHITVKDTTLWKTYVAGVQKSLTPFGAEVIFRGTRAAVLSGENDHQSAVVIKFSDQSTLQKWYNSPAYQNLIPIRDQAADVVLISYDA